MMRTCDHPFCDQWAQWHAVFEKKGVAPKDWKRLRFCQVHKDEHQTQSQPEGVTVKYLFVGAEPHGVHNPES